MKLIYTQFLTMMVLVSGFNAAAQIVKEDTVFYGPAYQNAIFYSFQNGEVKSTPYNQWHLAFDLEGFSATVRVNGGFDVFLYELPGDETAYASITDTNGLSGWTQVYDPDFTWDEGAFNEGSSHPDYGWGLYDGPPANNSPAATHNVYGKKAFVVQFPDSTFKKLKIDSLIGGNMWHLTYADLDGSNEVSTTINKNDYPDRVLVYYSLKTDQILDLEPAAGTWDIVFAKYLEDQYNSSFGSGANQSVTGVLTNEGLKVGVANQVSIAEADPDDYPRNESISGIGYAWKQLNSMFQWYTPDSLSYFVETVSGDVYQLWFTNFTTGSQGANSECAFAFKLDTVVTPNDTNATGLTANELNSNDVQVYPVPVSGLLNIALSANVAEDATISLMDVSGRILYSTEVNDVAGTVTQIDMSELGVQPGFYLVNLLSGQSKLTKRIIVQ